MNFGKIIDGTLKKDRLLFDARIQLKESRITRGRCRGQKLERYKLLVIENFVSDSQSTIYFNVSWLSNFNDSDKWEDLLQLRLKRYSLELTRHQTQTSRRYRPTYLSANSGQVCEKEFIP